MLEVAVVGLQHCKIWHYFHHDDAMSDVDGQQIAVAAGCIACYFGPTGREHDDSFVRVLGPNIGAID